MERMGHGPSAMTTSPGCSTPVAGLPAMSCGHLGPARHRGRWRRRTPSQPCVTRPVERRSSATPSTSCDREEGGRGAGLVEDPDHRAVLVQQRVARLLAEGRRRSGGDAGHALGPPAPDHGADGGDRSRLGSAGPSVPPVGVAMLSVMSALPVGQRGVVGERCHREVVGHADQRHIGAAVDGQGTRPGPAGRRCRSWRCCCSPARPSAVVATRPPSATATPTRETTPWLVSACSCTTDRPAACGRRRDLLALDGQRGDGDLGRVVAGGRRRRLIRGRGDQDDRPGDGGQGRGGADEDHGPRGWRIPPSGASAARTGTRRHLARVSPETVVGVDPATQRGVGAVGRTARILLSPVPLPVAPRVSGSRSEATEPKARNAVGPPPGRTMRPDVARSGH